MKIKIRPADKQFSDYIRSKAGWRCERCLKQYDSTCGPSLQCSHFWGRARENTRFDPENCSSLCFGCHNYFHAQPADHVEWMLEKLGKKAFDLLKLRAHTYRKKDDKLILMWLKQLK